MRTARLGSFRADGGHFLSGNQAYRVQNKKKQGHKDKRREVGEREREGKRQKKKMSLRQRKRGWR